MTRKGVSLVASVGLVMLLCGASTASAQATAPPLGTTSTYGVVSSTFVNTAVGTTIIGTPGQPALCYDVAGAPASPAAVTGTTLAPCPAQVGLDQATATADLNAQTLLPTCTTLPGGDLNAVVLPGHLAGHFPPGCYVQAGALGTTAGGTVFLESPGVYIFRSTGGALTTGANTTFSLGPGVCESDVFWGAAGATTLGANNAFVGTVLDAAGITIGQNTTWVGRALASGGTVTVPLTPVTVTVPTCAPFVPPVPPTVTKAFSPASITAGAVSRLTITLNNPNAAAIALTAAFTDTLPGGALVAATPNPTTTCGGAVTATAGGSTVTLPTGSTIPAGSSTIAVNVTAAAPGTFVNTIPAGALQTTAGNNAAPATATLTATCPPIAIGPPALPPEGWRCPTASSSRRAAGPAPTSSRC